MSTMSLENLITGRLQRPLRIVIAGVDGIGKSTFAAQSPAPIFLSPEDGTAHLDVTRFPQPQAWDDIMAAIGVLYEQEHAFKTLVLDSADWAERMARDAVCREHDVAGIESLPYGKGWTFSQEKFNRLLMAFDALYSKGMNIIVICHLEIKTFNDPEREPYDRYTLKLDKRTAPLLREWCDYHLHCNFDTTLVKNEKGQAGNVRAKSFGKREIHTIRSAAFDAKRRWPIPDRMPLDWSEFWSAHCEAAGLATQAA